MPCNTHTPPPEGLGGGTALSAAAIVLALFLLITILSARFFEQSNCKSVVGELADFETVAAFLMLHGEE